MIICRSFSTGPWTSDTMVGIRERPGLDEALLEIGMDAAGSLRGGGALLDRPGAGLFRADGEIGHQAQQLVAGADHAVEARLFEAKTVEEFLLLLVGQDGG